MQNNLGNLENKTQESKPLTNSELSPDIPVEETNKAAIKRVDTP